MTPNLPGLSHDRQDDPGGDAEDKDEAFVESEEAVENEVEVFLGDVEPAAVHFVGPVFGRDADEKHDHQHPDVDNRAPHEEGLKHLYCHNGPPVADWKNRDFFSYWKMVFVAEQV